MINQTLYNFAANLNQLIEHYEKLISFLTVNYWNRRFRCVKYLA